MEALLNYLRRLGELHGNMSLHQYVRVAQALHALPPRTPSLIFGCGNDTPLWLEAAKSPVLFVEDDPTWAKRARGMGAEVIDYKYTCKLGVWTPEPDVASILETFPDMYGLILVDGPRGYEAGHPGRQHSLYIAKHVRRYVGCSLFVHDAQREWDGKCCMEYFGGTADIIPHSTPGGGALACWEL